MISTKSSFNKTVINNIELIQFYLLIRCPFYYMIRNNKISGKFISLTLNKWYAPIFKCWSPLRMSKVMVQNFITKSIHTDKDNSIFKLNKTFYWWLYLFFNLEFELLLLYNLISCELIIKLYHKLWILESWIFVKKWEIINYCNA